MNATTRQYLFGLIFACVGGYYLYQKDYLEASLYLLAGLAFIFNTLTNEPKLVSYKKILTIVTWVLIITVGLVFLYVLQFKFL